MWGNDGIEESADQSASQITRGADDAFMSDAHRYVPPIHELEEGEQVVVFYRHKGTNIGGTVLEVNSDHVVIEDPRGEAVIIEASDIASFHTERLTEQRNSIFRVANPQLADGTVFLGGSGGHEDFVIDLAHPSLISRLKEVQKTHDDMMASGGDDYAVVEELLKLVHDSVDYSKVNMRGNVFQNFGEFLEEGICKHKSAFLQLMLQAVGIESEFQGGYVFDGETLEGHAWVSVVFTYESEPEDISMKYIVDPTSGQMLTSGSFAFRNYVPRSIYQSELRDKLEREGVRWDEQGIPNIVASSILPSPF